MAIIDIAIVCVVFVSLNISDFKIFDRITPQNVICGSCRPYFLAECHFLDCTEHAFLVEIHIFKCTILGHLHWTRFPVLGSI